MDLQTRSNQLQNRSFAPVVERLRGPGLLAISNWMHGLNGGTIAIRMKRLKAKRFQNCLVYKERCGYIHVDHTGKCVSPDCPIHGVDGSR